ncbi:SusC/RagA family TonB-linked outer membrane protein [Chitinophaga solisilvae]|uniref:SusC/RagA family TonB-linked outer membrane protein n=1 Tax=Chitinophaga solisilvae TaxID=1233460 RepID=UPI001369C298|nr:SusC/RagA family TonB-linked outer membrane protein [Chitinophaga solisilvae]
MYYRYFLPAIIYLLLTANPLWAQQQTVTGNVRDTDHHPVPGATVTVVNTTIGTVTDAEGRFSLQAPPNARLSISFTGFKTQQLHTATLKGPAQITLQEDLSRLDEIVVTGLATNVKRRNLANTVVTVSGKDLSGTAPAQTLDAALSGKVPGAYINANTGAPGGGISVKLRGVTSVYGATQPLYVVDGVFIDNSAISSGLTAVTKAVKDPGVITSNQDNPSNRIADIRPEDIENIEILKGASAAAIYGSRASAGVIIITTRKGRAGKTQLSLSQDLGFNKATRLLGTREFTADRAAALSKDPVASAALRKQFLEAEAQGKIYDYEKEIYGNTGFTRNTGLSLSGGSEKTDFFISAAQKDESGIVKNTGYRHNSIRLNVNHRVNDDIKIGVSTNFINSSADRGISNNDNTGVSLGWALAYTPSFAELHPDEKGKYPDNPFSSSNPLQTVALMRNNESVNRVIIGGNAEATWQRSRISTTKLVARGGIDFYNLQTDVLFPGILQSQAVNKGTSVQGFTRNLNTNFILSLVNTLTPSSALSLTTSAGVTQETGDFNNAIDVATQVITGQSNISQAGALTASQSRFQFQNDGWFIQEEVLIANALSLNAGLRFDRSSNNGDAGKFYLYPKGGIAFNFTKAGVIREGFFEDVKWRAAYGQATNVPAYGSKFTSLGIANIAGLPGSLVNPQQGQPGIQPERQTEFETGIDLVLLHGRLGVQVTWYNKNIYDFLMLSSPPASTGFASAWKNAGNLRNQGIELGLNARPVDTRVVTWNTGINLWLNRSEVTRLTTPAVPQGAFGYLGGTFQIEQGKSATQILGLTPTGIGRFGDAEPEFQVSSTNEVTVARNLSIRFLLHWKKGGQNINFTRLTADLGGTTKDYDEVAPGNKLPNGPNRLSKLGKTSEEFIEDADYFKIREIGVYYTFDKFRPKLIRSLTLGLSLNNYFTITPYSSYDPEVSNFGTGFSGGVELVPYPAAKRARFHLSVNF